MSAGSVSSVPGWPEALPAVRPPASRLGERMSARDRCEGRCLGPGGLPGAEPPEEVRSPGREPCDSAEMQLKVDFFRKLGYSSEEIHVVLQKLGLNADTNTVLGELVKHGPAERESTEVPPETKEAPLVPRGGGREQDPRARAGPGGDGKREPEAHRYRWQQCGHEVRLGFLGGHGGLSGAVGPCCGSLVGWCFCVTSSYEVCQVLKAWSLKTSGGFSLQTATAGYPGSGW